MPDARASPRCTRLVISRAVEPVAGIERMRRADGALREGLLFDLIGRMREDDVAVQWARELLAESEAYFGD